ncbi:uncharacterized protein PHACADRAFT_202541 [Phanerochaete carnosa HHB-10118-sp]|uniref:Uncharacterized protein n=1 Tax=Phanerochaete carnosa (strain HHB-10118-sp) TaxID=650164 RepID=K5VPL6_PHACS|nr:uncharacterized protein PHACADRAFT_202541 [Phanerochaete carnosa HHB-10118-sp]EKM48665.1 hypothetical protein PHACADRAFT_202541 [Phanerochaete carnosa HHB-10118-sp]
MYHTQHSHAKRNYEIAPKGKELSSESDTANEITLDEFLAQRHMKKKKKNAAIAATSVAVQSTTGTSMLAAPPSHPVSSKIANDATPNVGSAAMVHIVTATLTSDSDRGSLLGSVVPHSPDHLSTPPTFSTAESLPGTSLLFPAPTAIFAAALSPAADAIAPSLPEIPKDNNYSVGHTSADHSDSGPGSQAAGIDVQDQSIGLISDPSKLSLPGVPERLSQVVPEDVNTNTDAHGAAEDVNVRIPDPGEPALPDVLEQPSRTVLAKDLQVTAAQPQQWPHQVFEHKLSAHKAIKSSSDLWFWRPIMLLCAFLHSEHSVSHRAINILITVLHYLFTVFGFVDQKTDVPRTLRTTVKQLDLGDNFAVYPMCPSCCRCHAP